MLSELAELIRASWKSTLEALGTTSLSVVLWSIIVPSLVWLGIVLLHWVPTRGTVSLGTAMKGSLGEGLVVCGVTLAAWIVLFAIFFLRTAARDRISLREQIGSLHEQVNSLIAADVGSVTLEGLESHFFVERKQKTTSLGLVLHSNNDKLIAYHVDEFEIEPRPNYLGEFINHGGYLPSRDKRIFRSPKMDLSGVRDLEHMKVTGKLSYKISYNVVGTKAFHHTGKELTFEIYVQSGYVEYTTISEYED